MKLLVNISLILILFSCTSTKNISNNTSPKIKKITEAMRVKSSNRTREFALKNNINKISFYNQNGSVTEIHSYWLEDSISKLSKREVISLNENDKPIRGDVYDKDGQLIEYWICELDKNGRLTKKNTYNNFGEIKQVNFFIYDSNGNEIENSVNNASEYLVRKILSQYNSESQLIEVSIQEFYGGKNHIRNYSYKYDSKGNRIEQTSKGSDGTVSIFKNEYDDNDNHILMKAFDIDGTLQNEFEYKYIFDEFGNWITFESIMNGGQLVMIDERSIEYFN